MITAAPTAQPQSRPRSATVRTLQRYWQVTRPQWPMFLLAVLSTLGFIFFLSFANPWIMARVVDRVSAGSVARGQIWQTFGPWIIGLIAVNAAGQLCSKLQDYSVWKLELRANYHLATMTFDTLANQSMTFHSDRFGGSLVAQTTKFISAYATLLESLIYAVFAILGAAVFTIVMLAPIVPIYVAALVALMAVYIAVAYVMYKRVLPLNAQAAATSNRLSGELSDSITNILSVKTFGREAYERTLFTAAADDNLAADTRRMRASTARGASTSAVIVAIMALVVVFVAGGSTWFGISAGTLVMMFTYTYQLTMQFNRISQVFQQINRGFGDAHDMTLILDEPRLVDDIGGARPLVVHSGAIDFEQVRFCYSDDTARTCVFRDFNLQVPAGQRVGLVGKSGSGKTTLVSLLLRLSDLQSGRILIDGQNIADVTQVSLRQQVGYVPQEPLLFHRTIAENIAYGKPDAGEDEIREAARLANALEFIEQLPRGFQTLTGERGVKLSGGQRQRIAIARAILADAPILLLDEATSALDSESEKLIQDALLNLMRGRTSIVVAHRLSTIASLDRIIVLRDGAIVEDGTHEGLLAADGAYAQLWRRQSGAFLGHT
ncbi:MAG: ABC transporter ATP-binding protein/permease [Actinomycetes bacterium]|jgi:ATP-binding cassette subfamily B protein|nr:ABC transporter ATP-binding protein/permease [Actinomycetes bacterium]